MFLCLILLDQILAAVHGTGHEGFQKTLVRFRSSFYNPHASCLVKDFVKGCLVCQRNKTEHLHPAGLLQPLDVPHTVWSDIAMDFVEGFPKVGGKSVVLTVGDRFSKYAHFIALGHPYTALAVARIFFDQVVRLHGLPCSIVSDRDQVFTSQLWTELFSLAGVKLRLSSAFRPQTDGQSEVTNRVLGVYLQCLAGDHPKSWVRWLPWTEFCYNSSYQSALQPTPFKVVYGRDPPSLLSYHPGVAKVVALDKQLQERDEFLSEIRGRLLQAQDHMKSAYDKHHRELEFAVGDWVLLRLHHRAAAVIKDKTAAKLAPCYYGPFQVLERIGTLAYRLQLPPKSRKHDVVHVVFLKRFHGDLPATQVQLPPIRNGRVLPTPEIIRRAHLNRGKWELLVKWMGRTAGDATWEALDEFRELYPSFQPEDELFRKEGRSVIDAFTGRTYARRKKGSEQISREDIEE